MSKVVCPDCGVTIVDCRRYRLEALAEFMRLSMSATCIAVNVSGSTQKGGRCHGITRQLVERIAADLMAHPAEIWPEVIDHDIEDASRECAGDDCTERFIPDKNGHHRYCSVRCRDRAQGKRRRQRPGQQEKAAQRLQAWKDAHADEVREYNRRYQRRYMRQYRLRKRSEEAAA